MGVCDPNRWGTNQQPACTLKRRSAWEPNHAHPRGNPLRNGSTQRPLSRFDI